MPCKSPENDEVKVYTELPSWFKIDTPIGTYNLDWAVLFECDSQEKFYFVVESGGMVFEGTLRDAEKAGNRCGEKHFKVLGEDAQMPVT